jgi:hypothetical protein
VAFTLSASIVPASVLAEAGPLPAGAYREDLGFGLVFVDLASLDEPAAEHDPSARRHPIFLSLTASTAAWVAQVARTGAVAYVEAEYWGGVGWQAAAVWENSVLVLGPLFHSNDPDETDRARQADPAPSGAINAALERLGVRCAAGKDAFDTVGLHEVGRPRRRP